MRSFRIGRPRIKDGKFELQSTLRSHGVVSQRPTRDRTDPHWVDLSWRSRREPLEADSPG